MLRPVLATFLGPIAILVPLVLCLTVREYAHALTATFLGDSTPGRQGRVTLNPLAHADWLGTFVVPLATLLLSGVLTSKGGGYGLPMFAWAKPAQVDLRQVSQKMSARRAAMFIALSGPTSNLVFALTCALALRSVSTPALATSIVDHLGNDGLEAVGMVCFQLISMNIGLCVFHLLPFFPLDGARILIGILPQVWAHGVETRLLRLGSLPLLLIAFVPLFRQVLAVPMHLIEMLCLTVARAGL